ncbi:hypothetical protein HDU87_001472 [Geranomyces variabilis]|uniref:Uncharacterized protein n=1 Tax=Geranomyces variabilis TaxID=109894 RepID=A0AAD5TCN8_9FUNG|nr:hypothetical protein HDU87_001472 [Geranomyces variabilis]
MANYTFLTKSPRSRQRLARYVLMVALVLVLVAAVVFTRDLRNRWRRVRHPYDCSFNYPGPLVLQDLECLAEPLPFKSPVYFTKVPEDSVHDLRGIRTPGIPSVPIFIQFKDRVTYLLEFIRSLHRVIKTPFEIILLDDSSTFPTAVNFLNRLQASGVTVIRTPPKSEGAIFDEIYSTMASVITAYMNTSSDSETFIWTDPDVPLDGDGPGDILVVYAETLKQLNLHTVGCSLRWDNWIEEIRDGSIDNERGWVHAQAHCMDYRSVCYYFIRAPIDTTFAMFKKGTVLRRLAGPAIRMLPPLGCRHLDWMIEKDDLPADVHYYANNTSREINHSWFKNPAITGGLVTATEPVVDVPSVEEISAPPEM